MLSRGRQFLEHVVPAVMRPLRVLWNQMIGFVFLVLALVGTGSAVRSIRGYDGDAESFFQVALTCIFVLAMSAFALQSFLRARKASR
jgi:hypothetical protein